MAKFTSDKGRIGRISPEGTKIKFGARFALLVASLAAQFEFKIDPNWTTIKAKRSSCQFSS